MEDVAEPIASIEPVISLDQDELPVSPTDSDEMEETQIREVTRFSGTSCLNSRSFGPLCWGPTQLTLLVPQESEMIDWQL